MQSWSCWLQFKCTYWAVTGLKIPKYYFEGGKYGFGISLITKFFSKISLSLNFFETLSLSLKKEVDKRIFEPQSETLHRNVAHSTHFIFSTQRVQCYT